MKQTKKRSVPVNLRQSGDANIRLLINTQVRKSPFWHLSVEQGCWAATVYNKMYHPRAYFPLDADGLMGEYAYLTQYVTLWNVSVERQIQIKGPDALEFANFLVTRNLQNKLPVNQARYVILCDENGGIINDPVLLRVAEDEIWLSISDSDVLFWAKGINYNSRYNVSVNEIDVAPLQIQGPLSRPLMTKLFGEAIHDLKYYKLWRTRLNNMELIISRTGFSAEVGYEIYLCNASEKAEELWNILLEAGKEFDLRVIAPSHIRRIEAGILSYGQDMDIETNPFEVNLDWQVEFNKHAFIGKQALKSLKEGGLCRRLVGLKFGGSPITWYNPDFWLVNDARDKDFAGYITSAFYSPKLKTNIALAMLKIEYTKPGTKLKVYTNDTETAHAVDAEVVRVPFYDPDKKIPAS